MLSHVFYPVCFMFKSRKKISNVSYLKQQCRTRCRKNIRLIKHCVFALHLNYNLSELYSSLANFFVQAPFHSDQLIANFDFVIFVVNTYKITIPTGFTYMFLLPCLETH